MRGYADPYAHRYVDPFAHRVRAMTSSREAASADDDEDAGALDAIAADQRLGRREAPFADDPRHRVRPVGE